MKSWFTFDSAVRHLAIGGFEVDQNIVSLELLGYLVTNLSIATIFRHCGMQSNLSNWAEEH